MFIHRGGNTAGRGTYWNPCNGQRVRFDEAAELPGGQEVVYLRLHPFWAMVIAPVVGFMYIIFLPVFGVGTFFILCLVTLLGMLGSIALMSFRVCGGAFGRDDVLRKRQRSTRISKRNKKQAGCNG